MRSKCHFGGLILGFWMWPMFRITTVLLVTGNLYDKFCFPSTLSSVSILSVQGLEQLTQPGLPVNCSDVGAGCWLWQPYFFIFKNFKDFTPRAVDRLFIHYRRLEQSNCKIKISFSGKPICCCKTGETIKFAISTKCQRDHIKTYFPYVLFQTSWSSKLPFI